MSTDTNTPEPSFMEEATAGMAEDQAALDAEAGEPAAVVTEPVATETPATETPATETPTEPAAVETTEGEPAAGEPAAGEKPPRGMIEALDELGGSFGAKYADDAAAAQGIIENQKLLGRRDEDALYGKSLKPYHTELQEWWAARGQQQQAPQQVQPQVPQPEAVKPPATLEQMQLWEQEIRLARGAGTEPNPESERLLKEASADMQRRLYENAYPSQPPQPAVTEDRQREIAREELAGYNQQQQQFSQESAAVKSVINQNAPWMFVDGDEAKGYTTAGKMCGEAAIAYRQGGAGMLASLNASLAAMPAEIAKQAAAAPRTLPIPPGAMHQPQVATAAATQQTEQEKYDAAGFMGQCILDNAPR